jgi:hypothetical protein
MFFLLTTVLLLNMRSLPPSPLDSRDPRWGRNVEVASEEPLINANFGVGYTRGVQEGSDPAHLKTVVTLKHWDAYSLENSDGFTRNNFNAIVSNYALATTYLPAFRASIVDAAAKGFVFVCESCCDVRAKCWPLTSSIPFSTRFALPPQSSFSPSFFPLSFSPLLPLSFSQSDVLVQRRERPAHLRLAIPH